MISIATGNSVEIFQTSKSRTMAVKLPNNEMVLGRDHTGIILGQDGRPARKHALVWSEPPEMIGYCFPYVIGLVSRGVEVRSIETQSPIQVINLPKPRILTEGNNVYVASATGVWRLQLVSLLSQVRFEIFCCIPLLTLRID